MYEELERLEVREKEVKREDPETPHFGGEEVREEKPKDVENILEEEKKRDNRRDIFNDDDFCEEPP